VSYQVLKRQGLYRPEVQAAVVSAVQTAFIRARTSPSAWKHRQFDGRFDPHNVWRFQATGRTDIFRDRTAPGATKVNVHVLVDGSGSMLSRDTIPNPNAHLGQVATMEDPKSRIVHAMDIAATLADAFRRQPQVRLNVWLHNTNVQYGEVAIWPIVTNGMGRENIGAMGLAVGGGNGDGYAIKWVGEKVRRSHRKGEVDLLIVISDGLPSWIAPNSSAWSGFGNLATDGVALVFNAVQELRERGTHVLSIAIADNPNQAEMFGEQGVIPFTGNWSELAVNIGATLGATLVAEDARDRRR
jgi:hypothetical protein